MKCIDQILNYEAFSDEVAARRFMESYPSPKIFLTLRAERVEKLKTKEAGVYKSKRRYKEWMI